LPTSLDEIVPSVRLEQGFEEGSQIGVFYDPMIAKLVVHGKNRPEALRVLRGALEQYEVVGVSTNTEFLRTLAGHEAFINEELETGFIKVSLAVSIVIHDSNMLRRNTLMTFSLNCKHQALSCWLKRHSSSHYAISLMHLAHHHG
jgi:acetyl/propionyl-CoA carboxylase alpha subunit